MELHEPQDAAAAALATAPPADDDPNGAAGEAGPGPEAPPSDDELRLQLFAVVDTFDVLLRLALGPAMAATRDEKHELAEAWMPWAKLHGGVPVPAWLPGVLATASVYGPRFRARRAARATGREAPRDVDLEQA